MNKTGPNWFSEISHLWPGQALCLEIDKVLFEGKSDFQDVIIFKSKNHGTVLVLDNAIQLTEFDEFSYQEMISHLPIFAHPNPKKVLIIGGGDGAVLSQVVKHKDLEEIVLCEIDSVVIEKSKEFFPQFHRGWTDPRVKIHVADGIKFIKALTQPEFDVIIVDSSDPVGPATVLYEKDFYQALKMALKPDGIVCSQLECVWLHVEFIRRIINLTGELFNTVEYASTAIPTYPCGQIGFLICSLGGSSKALRRTMEAGMTKKDIDSLQYYHPEIHPASFVLPKFAHKIFEKEVKK